MEREDASAHDPKIFDLQRQAYIINIHTVISLFMISCDNVTLYIVKSQFCIGYHELMNIPQIRSR